MTEWITKNNKATVKIGKYALLFDSKAKRIIKETLETTNDLNIGFIEGNKMIVQKSNIKPMRIKINQNVPDNIFNYEKNKDIATNESYSATNGINTFFTSGTSYVSNSVFQQNTSIQVGTSSSSNLMEINQKQMNENKAVYNRNEKETYKITELSSRMQISNKKLIETIKEKLNLSEGENLIIEYADQEKMILIKGEKNE